VFRHPTRDALADLHAQGAKIPRVRHLRCTQDNFVRLHLDQINQTGIAACHLSGQTDDLAELFIEREFRADNTADPVQ